MSRLRGNPSLTIAAFAPVEWLKVDGEAIYGAGPSPFEEGVGGFGRKLFDGKGKEVYLPFLDWRCTTRPGKVYFTIFH